MKINFKVKIKFLLCHIFVLFPYFCRCSIAREKSSIYYNPFFYFHCNMEKAFSKICAIGGLAEGDVELEIRLGRMVDGKFVAGIDKAGFLLFESSIKASEPLGCDGSCRKIADENSIVDYTIQNERIIEINGKRVFEKKTTLASAIVSNKEIALKISLSRENKISQPSSKIVFTREKTRRVYEILGKNAELHFTEVNTKSGTLYEIELETSDFSPENLRLNVDDLFMFFNSADAHSLVKFYVA